MVKSPLCVLLLVASLFFTVGDFYAQTFEKIDLSPMDLAYTRSEDNRLAARIIYSRPAKRGREIFGEVVPYNEVWRTGANEASQLELFRPFRIGPAVLEPGTYTIYSIPTETEWTIIINGQVDVWGAFNYDESEDILRIRVPARRAAATIEQLSMAFRPERDGVTLMIGWDNVFVEVPMKMNEESAKPQAPNQKSQD